MLKALISHIRVSLNHVDLPGDDSEKGNSGLAEDLFLVEEGAVPSRSTPPLPPPPQHMLPMAVRSEEAAACRQSFLIS